MRIKVIGLGGAGAHAAGQLAAAGFSAVDFVAINTDLAAFNGCPLATRHQLGAALTRGLGAGGDPEMGRAAAEADAEKLRELCAEAEVVLILAGLGGGTGTGAAPIVAQLARESGAFVLAAVTLPFECEGKRRMRQAQLGLEQLRQAADAVITLPNQRVLQMMGAGASVAKTFETANLLLAQGLVGLGRLFKSDALIPASFADLCRVVRGQHTDSCLASAEIMIPAGPEELVDRLLAHPSLEGGNVLDEAGVVLVSLAGGPQMTMADVDHVMERIHARCDEAEVVLGAAVDEALTGRLMMTVVVARHKTAASEQLPAPLAAAPVEQTHGEDGFSFRTPTGRSAPAMGIGPVEPILTGQPAPRGRRKPAKSRQQQLPLEILSRGRFDKIEPTLHHGEDLDVPTFTRRNMPLN